MQDQPKVAKYVPVHPIDFKERSWPNKRLTQAPIWCSVDLRDGNQALVNPMTLSQKITLFNYLVGMGFKHIEVGFPAASSVEYDFVRHIIDNDLIPSDVTIQVLTQARESIIEKTMTAIEGASAVIVHLYNSTSTAQRKYVFNATQSDIIDVALNGVAAIKRGITSQHGHITLEYSPESFTGTEIDFAIDICNRVAESWNGPLIINLPATVELFTPNVYADMIEYACHHLKNRDQICVSVHTHNDRGTSVAATELALLAGADRVEGTLFGNGERTGNVDIVTVALNLYMQGIDPKLHVMDVPDMVATYTQCTGMTVHERHPYAGELVFTAFSGSHQDAINKGMHGYTNGSLWDVPYLAIDPADIGRAYEAIIRINSQSGKGGVAYVLEHSFHCIIPKRMQPTVARFIQSRTEALSTEIQPSEIWAIFTKEFVNRTDIYRLDTVQTTLDASGEVTSQLQIYVNGVLEQFTACGNGPIDASKKALASRFSTMTIESYAEHSLSQGSDSNAICYLTVNFGDDTFHGVGIDSNITVASIRALLSSINRKLTQEVC
jgi:2-isopropylmalate synthase